MDDIDRGLEPSTVPTGSASGRLQRHGTQVPQGAGALGVAGAVLPGRFTDWAFVRQLGSPATPIEHIIVACQENRSFDHYFGYAPQVQAAGFGPPPGYSQPNPGGTRIRRAVSLHRARDTGRSPRLGIASTASGTAARWTAS